MFIYSFSIPLALLIPTTYVDIERCFNLKLKRQTRQSPILQTHFPTCNICTCPLFDHGTWKRMEGSLRCSSRSCGRREDVSKQTMACKLANADLTPITLRCGNNATHLSNFSFALKKTKTWTMQTFLNRRRSRQDRKSGTFLSLHLIGCGSCVFKKNVSRFGLSRCPCDACSTQGRRKASLFYQCRRH